MTEEFKEIKEAKQAKEQIPIQDLLDIVYDYLAIPLVPHKIKQFIQLRETGQRDFSCYDLSGLDFTGIDLSDLNFQEAILNNIIISKMSFSTNINFRNASLIGAHIEDCVLSTMNFDGADLSNAHLHNCLLHQDNIKTSPASLNKTNIEGTYFYNIQWKQGGEKIRNANFDTCVGIAAEWKRDNEWSHSKPSDLEAASVWDNEDVELIEAEESENDSNALNAQSPATNHNNSYSMIYEKIPSEKKHQEIVLKELYDAEFPKLPTKLAGKSDNKIKPKSGIPTITKSQYKKYTGLDDVVTSNFGIVKDEPASHNEEGYSLNKK